MRVRKISGDAELAEQLGVWPGDDVRGNEFAYATCRLSTCVNGGFHAADVAFDENGEEATAGLNLFNEFDVGGFVHCVSGFDAADVAFGFDHAECSAHGIS